MTPLPDLFIALNPRPLVPGGLHSFVPNLLLTVAVAGAAGGVMGARLHITEWRLALWLMSMTVPVAYTWTGGDGGGTPGCHMGVPPWHLSLGGADSEILTNIALLIPAGATAFVWADASHRLAALTAALAIPAVVEAGQYLVPSLGRSCQFGDVLNNQIGVLVGWSLVAGILAVNRIWPGSRGTSAADGAD